MISWFDFLIDLFPLTHASTHADNRHTHKTLFNLRKQEQTQCRLIKIKKGNKDTHRLLRFCASVVKTVFCRLLLFVPIFSLRLDNRSNWSVDPLERGDNFFLNRQQQAAFVSKLPTKTLVLILIDLFPGKHFPEFWMKEMWFSVNFWSSEVSFESDSHCERKTFASWQIRPKDGLRFDSAAFSYISFCHPTCNPIIIACLCSLTFFHRLCAHSLIN